MSFELGVALRNCGLERCGRRAVLDGLAHFTDRRTGLASVSDARLAHHIGQSERNVRRVLKSILDDMSLAGLVRLVERGVGRGRRSTYAVDLARIEPLGQAVMVVQRVLHAGVAKLLNDANLTGKALTPDNIRAVFKALLAKLAEGSRYRKARLAVVELASRFEKEMANFKACARQRPDADAAGRETPYQRRLRKLRQRRQNVGQTIEKRVLNAFFGRVDKSVNPARFSGQKPDKMSTAYNIDNIPSGISPLPPRSGQMVSGVAARQGEFLIFASDLVATVAGWRKERDAFLQAFGTRTARVNRNGVVTVLCADQRDLEGVRRYQDGLMRWVADLDLAGLVFELEG